MSELVGYTYIKEETGQSKNISDTEFYHPLSRSQEMLKMLIGVAFYDEIQSQFPSSLSADNTALLPYIQKFLAWQSYQFWLPRANLKSAPSGIRVHKEDNSDAADSVQMGFLIRDAKGQAQLYKDEMINYIRKAQKLDSSKYPLFTSDCGGYKTGTGFHITAIKNRNTNYRGINYEINKNY